MRVGEACAGAEVAGRERSSPRVRPGYGRFARGTIADSHDKGGDVGWSAAEDVADRAKEGRRHACGLRQ